MTLASRRSAVAFILVVLCGAAIAQEDEKQAPIPFEGGTLTIAENAESGEKVLDFNGRELARNYVVYFNRIVDVSETKVALFDVGDGGNQCGPAAVIVWKPKDGEVTTETVGEDCGAPPASVTQDRIYFVPFPLPGESLPVDVWSPADGLKITGDMAFAPQPGTGWADIDPDKLDYILDSFSNAAVYEAAKKLLGRSLTDFTIGLQTGGSVEKLPSGVFYATGCVPHACGSSDAFMAVDKKGHKLYFAQQGDKPQPDTWPDLKSWPKDVRAAMQDGTDR